MALEHLLATRAHRIFVFTIVIQALLIIAMVVSTFGTVHTYLGDVFRDGPDKTIYCYLALFILAEVFELLVAYDALRMRNVIQLIGIILFHGALVIFSTLQVYEIKAALVQTDNSESLWRKVQPYLIVVPCIVAASWISLIFTINQLHREFRRTIFNHIVGESTKLKSMYLFYQIFLCLLKFDFFCFVGVTMQLLIVVLPADSVEFGLTIAAFPAVLMLIFGCLYAVRNEVKRIMLMALALMLPCMTYFYKLVRFFLPKSKGEYIDTRATLTVFTVFAFLLLLTTFLVGLKCFYDFDKGLLDSKLRGIDEYQEHSSPSNALEGMDEQRKSALF